MNIHIDSINNTSTYNGAFAMGRGSRAHSSANSANVSFQSAGLEGERDGRTKQRQEPPDFCCLIQGRPTCCATCTNADATNSSSTQEANQVVPAAISKTSPFWLYSVNLQVHTQDKYGTWHKLKRAIDDNEEEEPKGQFLTRASLCKMKQSGVVCVKFVVQKHPELFVRCPITVCTRAYFVYAKNLTLQVNKGRFMGSKLREEGAAKVTIKSADPSLLKQLHSNIMAIFHNLLVQGDHAAKATRQLAKANATIACMGSYNLEELHAILVDSLALLFNSCGTEMAANDREYLSTKYAKVIGVVRWKSGFHDTYKNDAAFKGCFELMQRIVVLAYNERKMSPHPFIVTPGCDKDVYLLAVLMSFLKENGFPLK